MVTTRFFQMIQMVPCKMWTITMLGLKQIEMHDMNSLILMACRPQIAYKYSVENLQSLPR